MKPSRYDHLPARERHERMRVEARILRLIRESHPDALAQQPARPRSSLLRHVMALLRQPRHVGAEPGHVSQ